MLVRVCVCVKNGWVWKSLSDSQKKGLEAGNYTKNAEKRPPQLIMIFCVVSTDPSSVVLLLEIDVSVIRKSIDIVGVSAHGKDSFHQLKLNRDVAEIGRYQQNLMVGDS